MRRKIKVLVVDDSATVRKVFIRELSKTEDIEVVDTAPDPYVARDKIVQLQPDVITLDIEMPRMDGITFLKKLMHYWPLPVIIVSSLTRNSSKLALEALSCGALEVISKPSEAYSVGEMGLQLAEKIRAVAEVRLQLKTKVQEKKTPNKVKALSATTKQILAMGASTGGTEAIKEILLGMPNNAPGMLVVQHMPARFTTSFAERLNNLCRVQVAEAKDGDSVINGKVLIAPGNFHLTLRRSGARYYVQVKSGPLIHHQRPAVDVLFHSVAEYAGANSLGILLTGMGVDGAAGLRHMREAGAGTIAQDEASSTVFGMPREAIRIGAVQKVVPLQQITQTALHMIEKYGERE
ncbi:MAG: chemotaxis response regulator protein-glutamate methylesterase [Desulfohalobiaceae bacterium]